MISIMKIRLGPGFNSPGLTLLRMQAYVQLELYLINEYIYMIIMNHKISVLMVYKARMICVILPMNHCGNSANIYILRYLTT